MRAIFRLIRSWIPFAVSLALAWFIIRHSDEISGTRQALTQANVWWLLAAIGFQALYTLVFAAMYQQGFAAAGMTLPFQQFVRLVFSALAISVAAPGGLAGNVLYVKVAEEAGYERSRALLAALVTQVLNLAAFALIVLVALAGVSQLGILSGAEQQAARIVVALVVAIVILTLSFIVMPPFLGWVAQFVSWVNRRIGIHEEWHGPLTASVAGYVEAVRGHHLKLVYVVGLACLAALAQAGSFAMVLLAYHIPLNAFMVMTVFAAGTLIGVVSPVPQGVGLVEGAVAGTLVAMSVPVGLAAAIAVAYRAVTFWLPFGVGIVLLNGAVAQHLKAVRSSWSVRAVCAGMLVMAMVNMLSALTSVVEGYWVQIVVILAAFALLVLTRGLWKRKRMAWALTLVVLVISAVSHCLKGPDWEEAVVASLFFVWLYSLRNHFTARSDPSTPRRGLVVVGMALLFTLVYGSVGFYFLDYELGAQYSLLMAIRQTLTMFLIGQPEIFGHVSRVGYLFLNSIYTVAVFTIGYGVAAALQPVFSRDRPSQKDLQRAKYIVEQYGTRPLQCLILLPNTSLWFSPGGSVVGFTHVGRTVVVLGGPIGPADDVTAVTEYIQWCTSNDWLPVFYQTKPQTIQAYKDADCSLLPIAEEGSIDLQGFTTEGAVMKHVRTTVAALVDCEYTAVVHEAPHAPELLEVLREVSDEWLAWTKSGERQCSLGWFDESFLQNCQIAAVYTPDGEVVAFASILPQYTRAQYGVDLIRRRRTVEQGVVDLLFVTLCTWAKTKGADTINIGLRALASVGDETTGKNAANWMHSHIAQIYTTKNLPDVEGHFPLMWEKRYIAYPASSDVDDAVLAVIQADNGGVLRRYFRSH